MRIRIKEAVSGATFSYRPGQIVDVDGKLARDLLVSRIGERVEDDPAKEGEPEVAALEAPERAVSKSGKKRKAVAK